jgi:MGT family glycosyltransferase
MLRFLFASMSAAGHIGPLLPVARELAERGHDVSFFTGADYRERVEAIGATFLENDGAHHIDTDVLDELHPERKKLKGVKKFKFDMREIFIAAVPGQLAALERAADEVRPDVVVVEPGMGGAASALHDRRGLPWVTVGISALMMPSPDTAPFGLGLSPSSTPLRRLRNRALHGIIDRTLFRAVNADYEAMCATIGIQPVPGGLFNAAVSPYLYLQPTVPSFEYPRSDLPAQARFVGPLLPPAPEGFTAPSWWDELEGDRPVVLVTQGTVATNPEDLLLPAFEALADEPVLVVGVTGGPDPAELGPVPANVRLERFVPFNHLLPHVSAVVTNGGYGGLHFALSHGAPVVVSGNTEEKPELVARVNWSGVGVGMRTNRPKPAALRNAVLRILGDASYAARARAMADEMARSGGAPLAADLVEGLGVRTGAGMAVAA